MVFRAGRRLAQLCGLVIASPAHRNEMLRRVRTAPTDVLVTVRALLKWRDDRRQLPLTRHHFSLYLRIHRYMHRTLGCFPNLVNPCNFNDKIQWLKLFDQSRLHPAVSDKLAVRDLVAAIDSGLLNELVAVLESADDLRHMKLPRSCVIKATHDSGSTVLVRDDEVDIDTLASRFSIHLRSRFGHESGEWSYPLARRRILVEEILPEALYGDLPDFKFHCCDGRVVWLQYIFERFSAPAEIILDRNAMPLGVRLDTNFREALPTEFKQPPEWRQLVAFAERLASGWKYVRVDLYNSRVGVRFGELTLFPYAGCYRGEGQRQLGSLLTFDRTTFRPPLTRQQRRDLINEAHLASPREGPK
jgi:hypothetical protein